MEPDFSKGVDGLLPAVVQDYASGEVLMLAYVNRVAWEKTLASGKAHYWSRSRNSLWLKGESSGNVQIINDIRLDCDGDTILYLVEQVGGAACHTGRRSCFYRRLEQDGSGGWHFVTDQTPLFNPSEVYKK